MKDERFEIFYFSDLNAKGYNVDYATIHFGAAPFNGLMAQLEPGCSSHIHNHFEVEAFLFLSGNGVLHLDEKKIDLTPGMGIRVSSFSNHIIENTSTSQPLRFMSIYWGSKLNDLPPVKRINPPTTLIFSPPTTPNGDLHLGHLSGPYLAADIYRRYLSENGLVAKHVTGRDDHQTYVAKKAEINNTTPKMLADCYSKEVRQTLTVSGIPIDYYITPNHDGEYAEFVKMIFQKLYDQGYIFEKDELAPFSAKGEYLHEAYIHGKCPFCHKNSDGNACEECGRPNDCTNLLNAYDHKEKLAPEIKPCKRLYFNFNYFNKQLTDYIKSTTLSAHALGLSISMLNEGLPDICVSHPSSWGIKTPIPGFQDQVIYVWFELAIGYLWGARQLSPDHLSENEKTAWFFNSHDARVVHFYGFDNTYYHTLLFPAIYFALGIKPPNVHIVNELLDLDGLKFSTSRGHLIWVRDLINRVPLDYLRWYLCEVRPEGSRQNFTLSHFVLSINQTFFRLDQWIKELTAVISNKFNHFISEPGAWTAEQHQFLQDILTYQQSAIDHFKIETFSTTRLIQNLNNLSITALSFLNSQKYFFDNNTVTPYARTALALLALALKIFALLARPIVPDTANAILDFMNIPRKTILNEASFIDPSKECKIFLLPKFVKIKEEELADILPIKKCEVLS